MAAAAAAVWLWGCPPFSTTGRARCSQTASTTRPAPPLPSLDDYRDSETLVLESDYRKAAALVEQNELDAAAALYESLGDYEDSADQAHAGPV